MTKLHLIGRGSENDKNTNAKFRRIKNVFLDLLTEVHLLFFANALPFFMHFNAYLQSSDPQAHKVYPMTKELADVSSLMH